MAMDSKYQEAEFIIIGSGVTGSTLGLELAKRGKKVLMLEAGKEQSITSALKLNYELYKNSIYTSQGFPLYKIYGLGGISAISYGTALKLPKLYKSKHNIDTEEYENLLVDQLKIKPLRDDLIGDSSIRIMGAAKSIGVEFTHLPKFFRDVNLLEKKEMLYYSDADNAKWTSRDFIKKAQEINLEVKTEVSVQEIIHKDGKAVGVIASSKNETLNFYGRNIILCAGGSESPLILLRSGVEYSGDGIFCDPAFYVTGIANESGTHDSPPESVGTTAYVDDTDGAFFMSHVIEPRMSYLVNMFRFKGYKLKHYLSYPRIYSLFITTKGTVKGRLNLDGNIDRFLSFAEKRRIDFATTIAEKILIELGINPNNISKLPVRSHYIGGGCALGKVVNDNLETSIENLYVCDSSILPESPGVPPILGTMAIAYKLALYLCGQLEQEEKEVVYKYEAPKTLDKDKEDQEDKEDQAAKQDKKEDKPAKPKKPRQPRKKKPAVKDKAADEETAVETSEATDEADIKKPDTPAAAENSEPDKPSAADKTEADTDKTEPIEEKKPAKKRTRKKKVDDTPSLLDLPPKPSKNGNGD